MHKKHLLYALAPALAVAAIAGTAFAAQGGNGMANDLVNAIATKFNLDPVAVQQVFDEQHDAMEEKMEQAFNQRLQQAVSNGNLTQAQADLVIQKRAELESQHESNRDRWQNLTKEEIRTAQKAQMDALKQWADDNNIPLQYLMPGGPGMGHKGFGRPGFARNGQNQAGQN